MSFLRTSWVAMLMLGLICGADFRAAAGEPLQAGPAPQPSGQPSLVPLEAKSLRIEFIRALQNEVQSMRQRQRGEFADLRASQTARRKDFEAREKAERQSFFAGKPEPAQKRAFIKDFVSRRKGLKKQFTDELKARKAEHRAAEITMRDDQKRRLKQFDDALNAGARPDGGLWPQVGH